MIILIFLSFLAVIGFLECIMTMLETVSMAKYTDIKNISLCVELKDSVSDVNFLLSTLMLQAERINYKNAVTKVVIKDTGLDENTYSQIYAFCLENDNIVVEK